MDQGGGGGRGRDIGGVDGHCKDMGSRWKNLGD